MRSLLFIGATVAGVACMGIMPAKAATHLIPGIAARAQVGAVEDAGWRRRVYRRWGAPYATTRLHMATIIAHPRMAITRLHLSIRRIPTMRRIAITGRTTLPITRIARRVAWQRQPARLLGSTG
jgi:hypothetical protein